MNLCPFYSSNLEGQIILANNINVADNDDILCPFQALKDLYTHLTPIQRVNIARHPNRPTFLDHIFNITEKVK